MKKQNIFLAITVLAALAFTACNSTSSNNAKAPKLSSNMDSLNYAYGLANGSDLKMSMMLNGDSADRKIASFMKGLKEGMAGPVEKHPEFSAAGSEAGSWLHQQKTVGLLGDSTMKINYNLVKQGLINALNKSTIQMTPQQADEYINKVMTARHEKAMAEKFGKEKAAGEKFMAENGKKQGITITASGLQYEVLKPGSGATPKATDRVKVHYVGKLMNDTVFDSSVARKQPAEFYVNQVIKGWIEGLQLMPVGSKYRFYIPQNLAYGAQDQGKIPPFSPLIFDVELLSIEKEQQPAAQPAVLQR